MCIEML